MQVRLLRPIFVPLQGIKTFTMLLEKLEAIKERHDEVAKLIADPEVIADMKRYIKLSKEYKDLEPIVEAKKTYKNVLDNISSAREILGKEKDPEFKEMARVELDELQDKKEALEEEIRLLLIPKDPQDDKNAIVEIRAGTGGDEAAIFAGDLYRMYSKFASRKSGKRSLST